MTHNDGQAFGRVRSQLERDPQLWLALALFVAGSVATADKISPLAGALFGAGASLLGAWITELNSRRSAKEEKSRRQSDAVQYLAPELQRTIERILYIHSRAIPNYSCAVNDSAIKPNDLQEDFVPYEPVLYPTAPEFRDLPPGKAVALVAFYDSLHSLKKFVDDWWAREGQLPVNIFNMILHNADDSLRLGLICIKEFELEKLFPPKYEGWGSISSRIEQSLSSAEAARKHHLAKAEASNKNSMTATVRKR